MTWEQEKELAREDGYQQGKAEGLVHGKTEIALAMLKKGFDVFVIMEITGLSENDIRKLID